MFPKFLIFITFALLGYAHSKSLHKVTNIIENVLEEKFARFYKLNYILPKQHTYIQTDSYSNLKEIKAGVPQGSVLCPVFYLLYTCNLPELEHCIMEK